MNSLKIPDDIKILRLLQQPKNRYQINQKIKKLTYPGVIKRIRVLENLGYVFAVREEHGRGPTGTVTYYLITAKGRGILRGHEEAERRKE